MSKRGIRHGAIIRCDYVDPDPTSKGRCETEFRSFSMSSIIRGQAASAGWLRVMSWQLTGDMFETAPTKADVCPDHKPIALTNAARRDQILQDKRDAEKKEREEKKAAKVADKALAKAARTAELNNKREAKAKEKAERAAARVADREKRAAEQAQRTKYRDGLKAEKAAKIAKQLAAKGITTATASEVPS